MTAITGRAPLSGLRLVLSVLTVFGGLAAAASFCSRAVVNRATTAPAASLVLEINLTQWATPGQGQASADMTKVQVGIYQTRSVQSCTPSGPTPGPSVTPTVCPGCATPGAGVSLPACPVALSEHQSLSVNGTVFPYLGDPNALSSSSAVQVPRQPPGGEYDFVYTDERGQKTRFSLPAPDATLAVTAPTPGQTVPIPTGPRAVPTAIPPGPGAPDLVNSPLTIRYTAPTFPAGATAAVTGEAVCGDLFGPGDACGRVTGALAPATGTYSLTDATTGYGYGFETFQPGPGSVWIDLIAHWTPAPAGFAGLRVGLHATVYSSITWGQR